MKRNLPDNITPNEMEHNQLPREQQNLNDSNDNDDSHNDNDKNYDDYSNNDRETETIDYDEEVGLDNDKDSIGDDQPERDEKEDDGNDESIEEHDKKKKAKKLKISIEKAQAYNEQMKQRGIIYIARIPPHMTPMKIKHLLSIYGCEVTKIFCQEEDDNARKRRAQLKGKRSVSKRYVEGWVEFADKKIAKRIALSLHQQRISNIKRNIHYDDYWCMKYLKSFYWNMLTEKIAYEQRIQAQQIRMGMIHDQKNIISHYQQSYDINQTIQHIQQRRTKNKHNNGDTLNDDAGDDK